MVSSKRTPRRTVTVSTLGALVIAFGVYTPKAATGQEAGDKVVTLTATPVMSGSEKLAEVEPGGELTVTGVKLPWVGVTVKEDGREVKGWVLHRNLIVQPSIDFVKLFVGYARKGISARDEFSVADRNSDGLLPQGEYRIAIRRPTLDDLNARLRQKITETEARAKNDLEKRLFVMTPGFLLELCGEVFRFQGWKAEPDLSKSLDAVGRFMKTRDIRRDSYLRRLVDTESRDKRALRAEALFRWIDKNSDNQLSSDEFSQPFVALVQQSPAYQAERSPDEVKDALAIPTAMTPDKRERASERESDSNGEMTPRVAELVRQLQCDSSISRTEAAVALNGMGQDTKEAVSALAEALRDRSGVVRTNVAQALTKLGPEARAAVPALIEALNDRSNIVRIYAIQALGNIGPEAKAAVPALTEMLDDRLRKRDVEQALKKIGARP